MKENIPEVFKVAYISIPLSQQTIMKALEKNPTTYTGFKSSEIFCYGESCILEFLNSVFPKKENFKWVWILKDFKTLKEAEEEALKGSRALSKVVSKECMLAVSKASDILKYLFE